LKREIAALEDVVRAGALASNVQESERRPKNQAKQATVQKGGGGASLNRCRGVDAHFGGAAGCEEVHQLEDFGLHASFFQGFAGIAAGAREFRWT